MSTDHEKLITEAAKALTGLTESEWEIATAEGTDHLAGYFDAAARVLAVFEKAHTPTDDEREALAKAMCAIEARSKAASLEEVQAGIQRWMRHRYEAERLMGELADYGFNLRRTVQGEPTGYAVVAAERAMVLHDSERLTCFDHEGVCCPCGVHSMSQAEHRTHRALAVVRAAGVVQGEPTDARVQDALKAYYSVGGAWVSEKDNWVNQFAPNMRAALRAAGVVSVQDEPDWEYGSALASDLTKATLYGDLWEASESVTGWNEAVRRMDRQGRANSGPAVVVQRRPAGPWVPVVDLPEGGEK